LCSTSSRRATCHERIVCDGNRSDETPAHAHTAGTGSRWPSTSAISELRPAPPRLGLRAQRALLARPPLCGMYLRHAGRPAARRLRAGRRLLGSNGQTRPPLSGVHLRHAGRDWS
jgi:hypothetical protein